MAESIDERKNRKSGREAGSFSTDDGACDNVEFIEVKDGRDIKGAGQLVGAR
jgi:hypothetical protein